MVHRREVGGTEIVLGNQGALLGNAMTWWDHETGSIWSQPSGEAVMGPRKGDRLELLPSTLVTWDSWRSRHPDTRVLDAPNGNIGRTLDDLMIVVELGPDALAFDITELQTVGVANTEVNGTPVVVVAPPVADDWAVFARRLGEDVVELDLVGSTLVARDGDATFDALLGLALEAEESLVRLPAFTILPVDYETFFPSGRIWESAE